MAAIVLRNYGGMSPTSAETANNPALAKYVRNLDLRQSDFRPFPQAGAVAAGMAPGGTLYRFDKSDIWITRPGFVNFVRGPIPNDATERTYYTGDGAPKVTDDTGSVRQLGVPAPAYGPPVVVNSTSQYSTDDAAADVSKKLAEVMAAVRGHALWRWTGLTPEELADRFKPAPEPSLWSYWLRVPGVLASGVFTPTNPAHQNLIDDRLHWGLDPQPDGSVLGCVALDVRSEHIILGAGMPIDLAAITDPSDSTGAKKLLSADQVETIVQTLTDAIVPAQQARDVAIARLREAKNQFVALADAGSVTAVGGVSAVQAFYATDYAQSIIDLAVEQAAAAVLNALTTFAGTEYTEPGTGGSGGGWTTPRNPEYYDNIP